MGDFGDVRAISLNIEMQMLITNLCINILSNATVPMGGEPSWQTSHHSTATHR